MCGEIVPTMRAVLASSVSPDGAGDEEHSMM
jgi:hypothetical protein